MQFLGLTSTQWLDVGISALIVILVPAVGRWFVALLLGRILRIVSQTETSLDDMLLKALRLPLYWLLFIGALHWALARLAFLPVAWGTFQSNFFFLLYLAIACVLGWRVVTSFFSWYGHEVAGHTKPELAQQTLPFFRRLALTLVGVISLIILLGRFDVDVSALVATLGIGTLAIALAAQAALADTISGFLIMIDRPFRVGDRIEIRDLDTWGDVVDIGLRSTRIRTLDNRTVIVPNSVIEKSLVVNHTYPDTLYRIQVQVGVAYGSAVEFARDILVQAVRGVEGVLPERPVEALFTAFGDSELIFQVRCWIDNYTETRRILDHVNTAVYKALNEAGILIPFPQRDVHLKVEAVEADKIATMLQPPELPEPAHAPDDYG